MTANSFWNRFYYFNENNTLETPSYQAIGLWFGVLAVVVDSQVKVMGSNLAFTSVNRKYEIKGKNCKGPTFKNNYSWHFKNWQWRKEHL